MSPVLLLPPWFPASSPCSLGVGLPKWKPRGEHIYSKEPCSVTACQRCSSIAGREPCSNGAGERELQDGSRKRMAKNLQGCMSHFFIQTITEIKCVSSGPGSCGTERTQSSLSVNLKVFLCLITSHYCVSLAVKERMRIYFLCG